MIHAKKGGIVMNGYITKQEVTGLQESLQQIINETDSQYVKGYFNSILELPKDEQDKWFLTSNEVSRIDDERVEVGTVCMVIRTVCAIVTTTIVVYNQITGKNEKKKVKEKKCEKKEVQVPCDEKN